MKCYKCPMIKEEFDWRIRVSEKLGLTEYDVAEFNNVDCCNCEKMGGKLSIVGRCSDAEYLTKEEWDQYREEHDLPPIENYSEECKEKENNVPKETKIQRKRNRDKEYKKKLVRLWKDSGSFCGAYPVDEKGKFDDENPVRYKRLYTTKRAKWIKQYCNKKVRRGKNIPSKGGYRKYSGFAWMLW